MTFSIVRHLQRLFEIGPDGLAGADRAARLEAAATALAAAGRADEAMSTFLDAVSQYEAEARMLPAIAVYSRLLALRPRDSLILDRLEDIAGGSQLVPEEEFDTEGPVTASPCERRKAALFSEFSLDELTAILEVLQVDDVEAGAALYRGGDPADALHLVADGEIALTAPPVAGAAPTELARKEAGELAGAISRRPHDRRSETAIATRPSRILRLTAEGLSAAAASHPRIWRVIEDFQAASCVLEGCLTR